MRRPSGILAVWLLIWLLGAVLLAVPGAWAKPTTPAQAQTAVMNWLGMDAVPLGAPMGRQVKEVQTFNYGDTPAYYVVSLNPAGLVILPADDLVEPVICFMPSGSYDPSPANPLGALVSRDLPGRVLEARAVEVKGVEALAPDTPQAQAQRKWDLLTKPTGPKASEFGVSSISQVWVAPLVQSKWDQSTVSGNNCYNYYTPYNYVCGCVATAMAQLMRFHQYPTAGVGTGGYTCTYWVGNTQYSTTLHLRGGDGAGIAYSWSQMELDPATNGVSLAQRQAIGALTSDAGISVNMDYDATSPPPHAGSGTETTYAAYAFVHTFGYSNAISAYSGSSSTSIPDSNRRNMLNPNLDAGFPTLLGIRGPAGGHAIVCDGYGYNGGSTLYHHLNMGWSGQDNVWYALPTVDTSWTTFNVQYKAVYNIFKTGSGEIISGRVTQADGVTPLSGATVTATSGGTTYNALAPTSSSGVYAIPKVPSGRTFTVTASKLGYASSSQTVTTGTSVTATSPPSSPGGYPNVSPSTTTGNMWSINFSLNVASIPLSQALDNTRLSFNTIGNANWYGESTTYIYGGSAAQSGAITHSQYTDLYTTVVGPGTLTFYWKVSSESGWDYLDLYIDATNTDWISGEVGWTLMTKSIPAGIHTITWRYSKDTADTVGSDCGWVDKVVYTRKAGLGAVLPLLLQ